LELKDRKTIEGRTVFLRQLSEENADEDYKGWLSDSETNKYLETRNESIEGLKVYIKEKNAATNALFLGVFLKENEKHVGNVKLEPIDFEKKTAIFGILIGDKSQWNKGLGTEVSKLVIDYAFGELGLGEITLGVDSENTVAIRLYKKLGFRVEKTEKRNRPSTGQDFEDIHMCLKKGDYARE